MDKKNTITLTEANQNFPKLIREVDEKKVVFLTRRDKEAYAVMDMETYEDLKGDKMTGSIMNDELDELITKNSWLKDSQGNPVKMWVEDGDLKLLSISRVKNKEITNFSVLRTPMEDASFKEGDPFEVHITRREGRPRIKLSFYGKDLMREDDFEAKALFSLAEEFYKDMPEGELKTLKITGHPLFENK